MPGKEWEQPKNYVELTNDMVLNIAKEELNKLQHSFENLKNNVKKNQIYYTFMEDDNTTISAVYAKVILEWYDCILAVVWPLRVNYKKNVAILSQVLQKLDQ